jgi:hypothetical protein
VGMLMARRLQPARPLRLADIRVLGPVLGDFTFDVR